MTEVEACHICADNFILNNRKINGELRIYVTLKEGLIKSVAECIKLLYFCTSCLSELKDPKLIGKNINSKEKD